MRVLHTATRRLRLRSLLVLLPSFFAVGGIGLRPISYAAAKDTPSCTYFDATSILTTLT